MLLFWGCIHNENSHHADRNWGLDLSRLGRLARHGGARIQGASQLPRTACRHYSSTDTGIYRSKRDGVVSFVERLRNHPRYCASILANLNRWEGTQRFGLYIWKRTGSSGRVRKACCRGNLRFRALPIAKYFPETQEHRISWKGQYFQSPTVKVTIPTSNR